MQIDVSRIDSISIIEPSGDTHKIPGSAVVSAEVTFIRTGQPLLTVCHTEEGGILRLDTLATEQARIHMKGE